MLRHMTKQNKISMKKSQPPIKTVQCQICITGAALVIQITSLLCFPLGCGREKSLDNGFHLPPSKTNHTDIRSTHCCSWRIRKLQTSTVGRCGAGWCRRITLCASATFHHTTSEQERRGSWQICQSPYKTVLNSHTCRNHARNLNLEVLAISYTNSSSGVRCINMSAHMKQPTVSHGSCIFRKKILCTKQWHAQTFWRAGAERKKRTHIACPHHCKGHFSTRLAFWRFGNPPPGHATGTKNVCTSRVKSDLVNFLVL